MTGRSVPLWEGSTPDAKVPRTVRMRVFESYDDADPLTIERFWRKVRRAAPTECWEWCGAKKAGGYGHMKLGSRYTGAHRFSFVLHKGPITSGLFVCHSCDNPGCVNPAHLWLGSAKDNFRDCMSKGRQRYGVQHGAANGSAKLSSQDVQIIRATPKTYGSGRVLAARFGVREATICEIRARRTWRAP